MSPIAAMLNFRRCAFGIGMRRSKAQNLAFHAGLWYWIARTRYGSAFVPKWRSASCGFSSVLKPRFDLPFNRTHSLNVFPRYFGSRFWCQTTPAATTTPNENPRTNLPGQILRLFPWRASSICCFTMSLVLLLFLIKPLVEKLETTYE